MNILAASTHLDEKAMPYNGVPILLATRGEMKRHA